MTEFSDVRGLPVTASDPDAVAALDTAIEGYLSMAEDVLDAARAATAADPGMPMGHILVGCLFMLGGREGFLPKADRAIAAARALGGNARERAHLEALRHWREGRLERANAVWDDILLDRPRDILAFRLAHYLHFYVGALERMRDSAARILPAWDEGVPGYGYVLGCRGFALEEIGGYAEAEPIARRAVDMQPLDIWAGHAVAHVLEMQGRAEEGVAWVDGHEADWGTRNAFRRHLWWHRSLYLLELGDHDRVLAHCDGWVYPEASEDNLDLCNAVSLLLRLDILGLDVGDRWGTVAEACADRAREHLRPFNDVHFTAAYAMAGRGNLLEVQRKSMETFAERHPDRTIGPITGRVAIPIRAATEAWAARDYGRVINALLPVRYAMRPLGGSWAQRDLWVRMLDEAAIRDRRGPLARALLAERLAQKPNSLPARRSYERAAAL